MVTIKNEQLTVEIAEKGAELRSIRKADGTDLLWNGRPEVWSGTAPIMFPICGGLKEDKFLYEGREYTLTKHGYAKYTTFEVEELNEDSVVLLHISDEKTKLSFPFDYELRVIYRLKDSSLKVDYLINNTGEKTMYFNIGAHEAYYTPEGIEDYDVIFDKEETLATTVLNGNFLTAATTPVLTSSKVLPLYDRYFAVDALVFREGIKSHAATLRNRITGRTVRVEFPDCDYFLLWHKYASPFICLEPWNGIPDVMGSSYDITEKEGITALEPGRTYRNRHVITFG